LTAVASISENLSKTDSWTSTRLVATQAWPAFRNLEAMTPWTALDRSAVGNMM
jgi:hypothetical protein